MKTKIIALMVACSLAMISCGGNEDISKDVFTVTFDTDGGTPVPEPQQVARYDFVQEPAEQPSRGEESFSGWYTQTGIKFNFKSTPVTKDITINAHYWKGPKKYVIINDYDWSYLQQKVHTYFGDSRGKDVAVGQGVLFYLFERPLETHKVTLKKQLDLSEQYDIPLLIQLDPITFWDGVPELWNWFDPTIAGYNEANKENVEWTSWSSDDAVKIGWLNWGSQIRLKPMANLFSKAYQAAVKERMQAMLSIVSNWYDSLPESKKYLLVGVKITGELGVGVNNWYYTGGNDLYSMDKSKDPKSGINMYNKPSRSNGEVSAIGYAGVKSAGIKSSGTLTGDDIAELERRFTLFVSDIADDYSIPREKLFAHAGGVDNDLAACINDKVCPAWSFYGQDATDASNATYCMSLLNESNAPYWGVAEWAIGSGDSADWSSGIRNAFKINKCRFLSIYTNVIGNNNGKIVNDAAVAGIKEVQNDTY